MQTGFSDFTKGSIPRHLVVFSVPMLLGNVLQAFYNTVDSIWVGRFLGPDALAAVSVSLPIIFALISVMLGLTMATTVMVAQFKGAGRTDMVRRVIINSTVLLVVTALAVSVLGILFHRDLLRLVNTPREIMEQASSYLTIMMGGVVFGFMYNAMGAILRGLGDSRTPLLFLAYATVVNIVLDPLMIFGVWPFPRMGVAGAALATVIAQAISFLLGVRYLGRKTELLRFTARDFAIDLRLMGRTLDIGLPAGVQQTLVSLSGLALSSVVNGFGKLVAAAYGACVRIDQFVFMPAMSVSLATSALAGQNLGAGLEHRVRETLRWALLIAGGISLVVGVAVVSAPKLLLSLFTRDAAVLRVGTSYLRVVALSYVPLAMMFTVNGLLRGAGDTVPTMFTTLGSLWLVRVPLARVLSRVPSLGSTGVWIAVAVSPLVGLATSSGYYLTGRWKRRAKALVGTVPQPELGAAPEGGVPPPPVAPPLPEPEGLAGTGGPHDVGGGPDYV